MSHQEEQAVGKHVTPYEIFLRQAIEDSKKQLDELYNEFANSNAIRKRTIKQQIALVNQNIDITTKSLQKYLNAMTWLREPTKERDEKAEELRKVPVDEEKPAAPKPAAPATKPPAAAAPKPSTPPPSVSASPRPTSTPVGASPKPPTVGTPIGKPVQKPEEEKKESEEKKDSS